MKHLPTAILFAAISLFSLSLSTGAQIVSGRGAPGTAGSPSPSAPSPGAPGTSQPGAGGGAAAGTPAVMPALDPASMAQAAELDRGEALNLIHHLNSLEIRQANEALGRLQNQQARAYAEMLITEHRANDNQLLALSETEQLTIYAFQPSTFEIATEDRLRALPAGEFDRGFLVAQAQGHYRGLQNLQQLEANVTDAEIRAAIVQARTAVQNHLNQAVSLLGQLAANPVASASPLSSPSPSTSPSASPSASPSSSPSPEPSATPSASPSPSPTTTP